VGVIESFSHQLSVFPNPAQEELFIQSESDIQMLNLYDNQGKCIFKGAPFSKNYNVDVRAWAPGIYMIKLQTQSGISTLQWIKQ
jgi:hypothetical protein